MVVLHFRETPSVNAQSELQPGGVGKQLVNMPNMLWQTHIDN